MAGERGSRATSLAVVALLAGLAAGAWALWPRPVPASALSPLPTGEAGRLAVDPMSLALADFGAATEPYDHVRTFPDLVALNTLNPAEVAAFRVAKAGAARVSITSGLPDGRVIVAVVRTGDRAAAIRTADLLDRYQLEFGLPRAVPVGDVARVVATVEDPRAEAPAQPLARAHYVHDDMVVRVQFEAKSFAALTRFGALLSLQTKVLPADG
ncbi:hypothetical protein GCM10010492_23020 [Saccharothrix mutabilis subsp. mutabilis]|uniref:Uncharacterized protein n=1 Tax=Saccharothrix mutabilis subsp. mutabilis TaxID=66855 RepID=A0ABP3D992_9PSEU